MSGSTDTVKGLEKLALAHELAVLVAYGQMIEILSVAPPFVARLGGPFPFMFLSSLFLLLFLLPAPSIARGRRWAIGASWLLVFACLADGFWFLSQRFGPDGAPAGWLSGMGLILAGLIVLHRIVRFVSAKNGLHRESSGQPSAA